MKLKTIFWLTAEERKNLKNKASEMNYVNPSRLLSDICNKPFIFLTSDMLKGVKDKQPSNIL